MSPAGSASAAGSGLFAYSSSGSADNSSSSSCAEERTAVFTSAKCPSDAGLENSCELPFGFVWTPMAGTTGTASTTSTSSTASTSATASSASNDPNANATVVVRCDGGALPPVLCTSCLAYMNPYVEMDTKTGIWSCALCGHRNVAPIGDPCAESLGVRSPIATALSSAFVEYRQPHVGEDSDSGEDSGDAGDDTTNNTNTNEKKNKQEEAEDYCTYLLVVDENLSPRDGQAIAPAVEAIFKEQLARSSSNSDSLGLGVGVDVGKDNNDGTKARIGLVVFGKSVSMYQLGFAGLSSAHTYIPEDSDQDQNEDEFDREMEQRVYLADIQEGSDYAFTSLRNSLASVFGVSVDCDDKDDEKGHGSKSNSNSNSNHVASRMSMLSLKKAARLRKEENGRNGDGDYYNNATTSNTLRQSPWVKRRQESLSDNPKRCTGEALKCALDMATANTSKPSRTSRIILFTNGCPNTGFGNVVANNEDNNPNGTTAAISSKKSKKRPTHNKIVDTEMLQEAVKLFDDLGKIAVPVGIGFDVFCSGVNELALPAYQAMVRPSGGYVLPLVALDTPHLRHNLGFIIENTYMARSLQDDADRDANHDQQDFEESPNCAECIVDIRSDRFVSPSQLCGPVEILVSKDSTTEMVETEIGAFQEGIALAEEQGFETKKFPSEDALDLSMTRIQMGRVDPLSTITVLLEVDDTISEDDEYAFFQLVSRYTSRKGDEDITRVSSFKIPIAQDVNDFIGSVDCEAMSVVLGKLAVYRSLHGRGDTDSNSDSSNDNDSVTRDLTAAEDMDSQERLAHNTQLDIDTTIQKISGAFRLLSLQNNQHNTRRRSNSRFSRLRKETSSLDFAFPPRLKKTLNRLYHLRRGPLISPGPMRSMDDRAEQRALFLRIPLANCLKMMRPEIWSTGTMSISSGWDTMLPFPPETLALWDDSIVAADFHDALFVWSGANCTAKRYDGIREKFETHLLEISKERFPMPELYKLSEGDSMARRFTARLAPSHADPIDNQIASFPALSALKPHALEELRSKFKFYDSNSDESFRTWFWSVASASNKDKMDGMSLCV